MNFKKLLIPILLLLSQNAHPAISERDIAQLGVQYNYNTNAGCESGTTGYSAFHTTFSSGIPTTITAGSTLLSVGSVTTNVLQGNASCQMNVTTATGSVGHGIITAPLTIKDADLAKVIATQFDYNFVTGFGNVDVSGTSTQTVQVWIYNVNLGTWYQPAGYNSINTIGTSSQFVPGKTPTITFQSDVSHSNNQYRIALIIANAPTGTFKMNFDNMVFGRPIRNTGPAVTDWKPYTPVWTSNSGTAPAIGNGTISGIYRKVGGALEAFLSMSSGSTTTYGSTVTWAWSIPSGLSIDTTQPISIIGEAHANISSGSIDWGGDPLILTPTQVAVRVSNGGGGASAWESTSPATWSNPSGLSMHFTVPIVGWSSDLNLSNDTDTRVVAMRAYASTGQTFTTTASAIQYNTIDYDTHGAYNTSTFTYTIPVSGYYDVFFTFSSFGSAAAVGATSLVINGVTNFLANAPLSTTLNSQIPSTVQKFFNAGTTLTPMFATGSGTSNQGSAGATGAGFFQVTRRSGPSVIAASESVAASYNNQSSQSIPNSAFTTITGWTKEFDSHNAFNATTGIYTVPVSGTYYVYASQQWGSSATGTSNNTQLRINKNGTSFRYSTQSVSQALDTAATLSCQANGYPFIAGDQISFSTFQNSGSAQVLDNSGQATSMSIVRTGN